MKAVTFYKSESNKRKSINSNTSNPTTGSFNNSNNNSSSIVCCDVENCESTSFKRCRTANCSKNMCKAHWPQKGGHQVHVQADLQFKRINSLSDASNYNI